MYQGQLFKSINFFVSFSYQFINVTWQSYKEVSNQLPVEANGCLASCMLRDQRHLFGWFRYVLVPAAPFFRQKKSLYAQGPEEV